MNRVFAPLALAVLVLTGCPTQNEPAPATPTPATPTAAPDGDAATPAPTSDPATPDPAAAEAAVPLVTYYAFDG